MSIESQTGVIQRGRLPRQHPGHSTNGSRRSEAWLTRPASVGSLATARKSEFQLELGNMTRRGELEGAGDELRLPASPLSRAILSRGGDDEPLSRVRVYWHLGGQSFSVHEAGRKALERKCGGDRGGERGRIISRNARLFPLSAASAAAVSRQGKQG